MSALGRLCCKTSVSSSKKFFKIAHRCGILLRTGSDLFLLGSSGQFCNTIGPKLTCRTIKRMSDVGSEADIKN